MVRLGFDTGKRGRADFLAPSGANTLAAARPAPAAHLALAARQPSRQPARQPTRRPVARPPQLASRLGQAAQRRLPSNLAGIVWSINWPLLLIVGLLAAFGLAVVYSALLGRTDYSFSHQLMGVGLGVLCMAGFWALDYRLLARLTVPAFVLAVILILSPLIPGLGVESHGARNWISLFGQQVQPGEFGKLLIIVGLTSLTARYNGKLNSGREYLKCLGLTLLPVAAVALQPDIGTALVYLAIGMTVLFCCGANRWWLAATLIVGTLILAGILIIDPILDQAFGHDVLVKQYQMNRLLVFLNEDLDPSGLGYNLRQAKIAIGSGAWTGAGWMQGTQSSLGFLPEAPTDFIFCVLAEEFGFLGALGLLGLYTLLTLVSLRVALRADGFGALLIAGCLGMWIFQILENIGMTCGLMPITGIPLPFMSYGSSFMVVNFCAIGLILSVSMRQAWDAQSRPGVEQPSLDWR